MSYVLKLNNEQIAISGGWNPRLFGQYTQTSYPKTVDQSYVWGQDGYWLGWVADPEPAPAHPNASIYEQIAEIEANITPRRLREAVLTESGAAWLAAREQEIEVLRQQLI